MKQINSEDARELVRSLATSRKAKDGERGKPVVAPDLTVLPGFVEASTGLPKRRVDGEGVGVADLVSATSFASTSTPSRPPT